MDPQREALHPDSPLIVMTGPLAATAAPAASRWLVCGKSPLLYPENFACAHLGGFFGARLKLAGYDGLVIKGKADSRVYLSIDNQNVTIQDAGHLWGLTTDQTMQAIRSEQGAKTSILTTGPAGEQAVRFATVATDAGGSGSMGFGAVMGAKNLKAVAVRGTGTIPAAHPDRIREIRQQIKKMTGEGYYSLYGTPPPLPETEVIKKIHCHGCPQGCWRSLYRMTTGEEEVRKCQAAFSFAVWDKRDHGDLTKTTFLGTTLANRYSLCTMALPGMLIWLEKCVENGVISEKDTGLPLHNLGSIEALETVVQKIVRREGFGNVLAEGVMRAADSIGSGAREAALDHFTRSGWGIAYGPKVFSTSAPIYATEVRPSITALHEICGPLIKWALWHTTNGSFCYLSTEILRKIARRFWGGEDAVDFSTYAGKARTAVQIQNRQHAKDSLILCDFAYPVFDDASTADHVGDPALESRLFAAVTGKEMDETGLNRAGERIFNLHRAILLREGRNGREDDCLTDSQFIEREEPVYDAFGMFNPDLELPGKADEIISRKGKALDRDGFRQMMDEYYELRGWDAATGFLRKETLARLDLTDLIEPLQGKVR